MARDLGVGIVGYGVAGQVFHRPLVDATPGLRVAAVMVRNEERAQKAREDNPEAAVVADFNELLRRRDVDVVVLATPHDVHCEQAVAALRAGRSVVVDKIMARSVAEADRMIRAAALNRQVLTVFHNRRWDSDWLTLLDVLKQGLLGEIWSIDVNVARPSMPLRALGEDRRWRAQAEHFGGQLVDWGAHLMDQVVLLAGSQPERVFCDLQYKQEGNENDTEAYVALRYDGGLRVTVTVSVQSWTERPHWRVHGSLGSLRIEGIDPQESITARTGRVAAGTPEAALPEGAIHLFNAEGTSEIPALPGNWLAFYENLRQSVLGHADPVVTPEHCRNVLRLYERLFRAAGKTNVTTSDRSTGLLA